MAGREYSKRLGSISDEQLQDALDRFDLGQLLAAEPLTTGLFGQNLLLTASTGDYVFRGAPHWNADGEDDWQFPKERYFAGLIHHSDGGLPVAWPYLVETRRDIFGWGFALQPRLDGAPLGHPMHESYSPAEIAEQSRELGRALGMVHKVRVQSAGTYDLAVDAVTPFRVPYSDYVLATVEGLLQRSQIASAATTGADIDWARSVLAAARPALEMPFQACVVHLDYGFHNVLFAKRDDHWKVTGVVDWMTAEAGHRECDLARPLAADHQYGVGGRDEFLGAYYSVQPQLPGFFERFRAFMLWERLLIWEYWQRHNGFPKGLGMRRWMEPFVTLLG
jgi:aminoglycoside phosphotransferase (APT) family kinase protein